MTITADDIRKLIDYNPDIEDYSDWESFRLLEEIIGDYVTPGLFLFGIDLHNMDTGEQEKKFSNLEDISEKELSLFSEKVDDIIVGIPHLYYKEIEQFFKDNDEKIIEQIKRYDRSLMNHFRYDTKKLIKRFKKESNRKKTLSEIAGILAAITKRRVAYTYCSGDYNRNLIGGFNNYTPSRQRLAVLEFVEDGCLKEILDKEIGDLNLDHIKNNKVQITIKDESKSFIVNQYGTPLTSDDTVGFIGFEQSQENQTNIARIKRHDQPSSLNQEMENKDADLKKILDLTTRFNSEAMLSGYSEKQMAFYEFKARFDVDDFNARALFESQANGEDFYGSGITDLGGFGNFVEQVLNRYLGISEKGYIEKIENEFSRIAKPYDSLIKIVANTGDKFIILTDIDKDVKHTSLIRDSVKVIDSFKKHLRHFSEFLTEYAYEEYIGKNKTQIPCLVRLIKDMQTAKPTEYGKLTHRLYSFLLDIPDIDFRFYEESGGKKEADRFNNILEIREISKSEPKKHYADLIKEGKPVVNNETYGIIAQQLKELLKNKACLNNVYTDGNNKDINELEDIISTLTNDKQTALKKLKEFYNGKEQLSIEGINYDRKRILPIQKYIELPDTWNTHGPKKSETTKPEVKYQTIEDLCSDLKSFEEIDNDLLMEELCDLKDDLEYQDSTLAFLRKKKFFALNIKAALSQCSGSFEVNGNDSSDLMVLAARILDSKVLDKLYSKEQMILAPSYMIPVLTKKEGDMFVNFSHNIDKHVINAMSNSTIDSLDAEKTEDGYIYIKVKEREVGVCQISSLPFDHEVWTYDEDMNPLYINIMDHLIPEDSSLFKLKDLIVKTRRSLSEDQPFSRWLNKDFSPNLNIPADTRFYDYLKAKIKDEIKTFNSICNSEILDSSEWDKTSFWTEYNTHGGNILATAAMLLIAKSKEQDNESPESISDHLDMLQPVINNVMISQLTRHVNPYEKMFYNSPYEVRNRTIKRKIEGVNKQIREFAYDKLGCDKTRQIMEEDSIYRDIVKITDEILHRRLPQPYLNGRRESYIKIFYGEETEIHNIDDRLGNTGGLFEKIGTEYSREAVLSMHAILNPLVDNNFQFSGIKEDGSVVINDEQIKKQIAYNRN